MSDERKTESNVPAGEKTPLMQAPGGQVSTAYFVYALCLFTDEYFIRRSSVYTAQFLIFLSF
jgi:hypothetical protein